jgi:hypothetical protein
MKTENEIRNQIAIGKTLHEQGKWDDEPEDRASFYVALEEKWEVAGYITALKYVLGEMKPKFVKEDIS